MPQPCDMVGGHGFGLLSTQIKTTQRYTDLSHDTLLDATNSVNTTLGDMFVPKVAMAKAGSSGLMLGLR